MNPIHTQFLAADHIADLRRASGPWGPLHDQGANDDERPLGRPGRRLRGAIGGAVRLIASRAIRLPQGGPSTADPRATTVTRQRRTV